jgi:hypothetical protein
MQVKKRKSLEKYGISLNSGPVSDPGLGPSGMEALQPCSAASPSFGNEPATFTISPKPSKRRFVRGDLASGPARRSSSARRRPGMSGEWDEWS